MGELKIDYTLERHLSEFVKMDGNLEVLETSYKNNKSKLKKMLGSILINYPHYSTHDSVHAETIISSIELFLGEERIKQLNACDTWMLLHSAYVHDLGMIVSDRRVRKVWETDEFQKFINSCAQSSSPGISVNAKIIKSFSKCDTKDLYNSLNKSSFPLDVKKAITVIVAEFFRARHHISSSSILRNEEELNLDLTNGNDVPLNWQGFLSEISKLHGMPFEDILELPHKSNGINSQHIHPRFAAAMLRIGDLLDMQAGRFDNTAISVFGMLERESLGHYFKHKFIKHVYIDENSIEATSDVLFEDIKQELEIMREKGDEVSGDSREIAFETLKATRDWFNWIEEEMANLFNHWTDIVPEKFIMTKPKTNLRIKVDGKDTVYSDKNLRLTFDRNKTFDLIQGINIYNDKHIFVRELIQNSLDALKLQFWRDIQKGVYDSQIDESHQGDISKITPFSFNDSSIYYNYNVEIT
ncbi:MAG TPA: hypothetical protein VF941_05590, partial [Clostridia bacterium]